jgi:type II secretory pathway component GspD/PulD (secretin)
MPCLLVAFLALSFAANARAQAESGQKSEPRPKSQAVDATLRKNQAVKAMLKQKIALNFRDAPLEDVLKFVKAASSGPADDGITFKVDEKDLKRLGLTLTSRISIMSRDRPLEDSLRDLLKSVRLDYEVEDGVVRVRARRATEKTR